MGTPYAGLKGMGIAAIAFETPHRIVSHAAMLYRRKKEVRVFEMVDHKKLRDDVARPDFVWIEPAIPPERVRLVYERARLVYRCHQENAVPYGFGFRKSTFDERGKFLLGDGEFGFTCSTIVVAILEAEGVPLLAPDTWPDPDPADIATRKAFLRELRKTDADHAKLLEVDIEAPRISPEEVVAAAAIWPPPGNFDNLQDGAAVVRKRIGT